MDRQIAIVACQVEGKRAIRLNHRLKLRLRCLRCLRCLATGARRPGILKEILTYLSEISIEDSKTGRARMAAEPPEERRFLRQRLPQVHAIRPAPGCPI